MSPEHMNAEVARRMSGELATQENLTHVVEQVVVGGDLSKLSAKDRLHYYNAICKSVGLNPLTRPFDYLHLSGKLVLYAKRDATDQLRKIHGVSILPPLERETVEGVYVVTANARDKDGRIDSSIGAVPIENLKGEARANAIMKAETKAKRRVTLSICGLGMLDETETGSIPDARPVKIDYDTGEVLDGPSETSTHERTGPVAHIGGAPVVVEDDEPLNEELKRSVLLAQVKGAADRLGWKADKRAAAWDTYCQGMDPRTATLEALNDLYAYLLAQRP
jgi:hypothetical protein